MTVVITVCAVAALVCWLAISPVRLVIAIVPAAAAHPALTAGIILTVAAAAVTVSVVVIWRNLATSRWLVAVMTGPAPTRMEARHG
jgi:hypothetical protein